MRKIAVLGGVGDFGSFHVKFFKNHSEEIIITGRDKEKGLKKAMELGVVFENDNSKSVFNSDIIIVCTFLQSVPVVIDEINLF